jgi:hypothetical protein
MAKGGDAYLAPTIVFKALQDYNGKLFGQWDLEAVENDLSITKKFAQGMARKLVVNHSMLDVVEEGIQHLTGTKVENDELPWVKKPDAA